MARCSLILFLCVTILTSSHALAENGVSDAPSKPPRFQRLKKFAACALVLSAGFASYITYRRATAPVSQLITIDGASAQIEGVAMDELSGETWEEKHRQVLEMKRAELTTAVLFKTSHQYSREEGLQIVLDYKDQVNQGRLMVGKVHVFVSGSAGSPQDFKPLDTSMVVYRTDAKGDLVVSLKDLEKVISMDQDLSAKKIFIIYVQNIRTMNESLKDPGATTDYAIPLVVEYRTSSP